MKIAALSTVLCLAATISATGTEKVMGSASYTNKTFKALEVMGTLTGSGLKASTIDVYGPTNLKESVIGMATILGPLSSDSAVFTGPVEVHGNIQAIDTTFKDTLSTEGNEVEVFLEDSTAKDISITGIKSGVQKNARGTSVSYVFGSIKKEPQGIRVLLKGKKTLVLGPIEFIDEPGTVLLSDGATFSGRVINGKVIEKEAPETKKIGESQEEGKIV